MYMPAGQGYSAASDILKQSHELHDPCGTFEDSPGSDSINEDPLLTVVFRTMFDGNLRLQNPGTPIQGKPANYPIQSQSDCYINPDPQRREGENKQNGQ
jgi:hypothetical protein